MGSLIWEMSRDEVVKESKESQTLMVARPSALDHQHAGPSVSTPVGPDATLTVLTLSSLVLWTSTLEFTTLVRINFFFKNVSACIRL